MALRLPLMVAMGASLCGGIACHKPLNWALVTAREPATPGLIHERLTSPAEGGLAPLNINVLRIDLRRIRLDLVLAQGKVQGTEVVSALARRHGALAAVNGGFFEMVGPYAGEPDGLFIEQGAILSEPAQARSSFGVCDAAGGQRAVIHRPSLRSKLRAGGGAALSITGINRARGREDLVLYTERFGPRTLTDGSGLELVVSPAGRSSTRRGSSEIPRGGFVLSGSGERERQLARLARRKGELTVVHTLNSLESKGTAVPRQGCSYTSAGPRILQGGKAPSSYLQEGTKFRRAFSHKRHPRTAVGIIDRHQLVLVVVDGRQPELSAGMSLPELGRLLLRLGARDGYNLDGGGSSTMILRERIINRPSDKEGERPVSDAVLLFPREIEGR